MKMFLNIISRKLYILDFPVEILCAVVSRVIPIVASLHLKYSIFQPKISIIAFYAYKQDDGNFSRTYKYLSRPLFIPPPPGVRMV